MVTKLGRLLLVSCAAAAFTTPALGQAQEAENATSEESSDIIVTANKREQNLNEVGLTITAIPGAALSERNLTSIEDVASIIPGLSFAQSASNTPILTLRGVGFNETSLGVYPAVTVYQDQIPLVFPVMALHASYDVERVEVLKGPQGTLFGQNSTGGAINYIAAKPTDTFQAGIDVSYGRFNSIDANAFISGPLSDTVRARLALNGRHMDAWQKSYTRRATTGKDSYIAGRFLIDFDASEALTLSVNLNGWKDKSEPQAPQFFGLHEFERTGGTPDLGAATPPINDPLRNAYSPPPCAAASAQLCYPFAPRNARAADFTGLARDPETAVQFGGAGQSDPATARETDFTQFGDRRFLQGALRGDLELGGGLTLTSLTSYADFKQNLALDADGTALVSYNSTQAIGRIKTFNQELRVANDPAEAFRWLVGANYEDSKTLENQNIRYFANGNYSAGSFYINSSGNIVRQKIRNYAFFTNLEFDLTEQLTLKGAVRYTNSRNRNFNIGYTNPNGNVDKLFNLLGSLSGNPFTPITPDQNYTLNTTPVGIPDGVRLLSPTFPGLGVPGIPFEAILKEDNVSWRVGLDYQATPDLLIYGNVSRGYKAGSFPTLAAAAYQAVLPVTQEKVTAYELGVKASLFDRLVQLNAAGFYYDYRDKQVRGKFADAVFGLLDLLVNIPKSEITGFEADITVRPTDGLTLSGAVTYLDAKIKEYRGFDIFGGISLPTYAAGGDNTRDFGGVPLPYTPKWSGSFNLDYRHEADFGTPFFGFNVNARTKQDSAIGASVTPFPVGPRFRLAPGEKSLSHVIEGYATVDARVGFESADERWRVFLWGKNIFDKYYFTAVSTVGNHSVRYTGRPATYGITVGLKLN